MSLRPLVPVVVLVLSCKDQAPDRTPASIKLVGIGAQTLQSGSTMSLSTEIKNAGGEVLTGSDITVTWTSSSPDVASVTAAGLVTGIKVGQTNITAGVGSLASSTTITVTPGAASQLSIIVQPGGAISGAVLSPQPKVVIQDAAGNVVTAAAFVGVVIASGGGTLQGGTTVQAISGIAMFTDLAVRGAPGDRTLTFSSGNLTSATSTAFTVALDPTPSSVTIAPTGPQTLTSGAFLQLSATVKNQDGVSVPASVTWGSKQSTIASVDGAGLVTGKKVGTTRVGASVGSVTDSVTITVQAGAAIKLAMRRQPAGAVVGSPIQTQPIVEVEDVNGNLVASATPTVTASLASGPGSLTGTLTASASSGAATFADLTIANTGGTHALSFSAPNLTSVTSASFVVNATLPILTLSQKTLAYQVGAGGCSATAQTSNITNTGGGSLAGLAAVVHYTTDDIGWVTSASLSSASAPSTLTINVASSTLPPGTYSAYVVVGTSDLSASPDSVAVTMTVQGFANRILYGAANAQTYDLGLNGTVTPAVTAFDVGGGALTQACFTFASRAPQVVSVDAAGTATAIGAGGAFVVATATGGARDSIFVQSAPSTGPVLRTNTTQVGWKAGNSFTVSILLDMRGATLGAATIAITWANDGATGILTLGTVTAGADASGIDWQIATNGQVRATVSYPSGAASTGVLELLKVQFTVRSVAPGRSGWIYVLPLDLVNSTLSSITTSVTPFRYPLLVVP